MADVYTPPPDSTYLLLTPFQMPTESGPVWAMAFSGDSATFLTAALSVALTVIFVCIWNVICFLFIFLSRGKSQRRYAALVTLWNSNDAWFAFRELASYTYHYFNSSAADFWYGLALALLAFCVYGGSLALGIVGPSLVRIGSVAPVRPSIVFYPATPAAAAYADQLKDFGIRAPSVLRALGSVEAAKVTMRPRVRFDYNKNYGTSENNELIHQLTYGYRLGGVELGLQQGAGLELAVDGGCVTEYGWYDPGIQTENVENYTLWKNSDGQMDFIVPIDPYSIQNAPKASFISHPGADAQFARNGTTSFAIIVWSAHRSSISSSDDPWYATESRNSSVPRPYDPQFWMKRARPVLSCWEKNTWSWAGQAVSDVTQLRNVAGIKVAQSLLSMLEAAFTVPTIVRIGNASGDSALRSRTTSPNGVIDASASSIHDDLERLLVASFVASRNVFVDAIMFEQDGTYPNLVEDSTGQPAAGAGDFVISSPDIQTFSLGGIIAILVILILLLLTESAISCIIRLHHQPKNPSADEERQNGATATKDGTAISAAEATVPNDGTIIENNNNQSPTASKKPNPTNNRLIRFKVLMASQLFRRIYETAPGQEDKSWPCEKPFPEVTPENSHEFDLAACAGQHTLCKGHIAPS
ncbi:hypothetical protein MFIFM68171_07199 [Madurella fahalii]|uniref:Uncharacterized protein n=1 Tax=Madurella fahalii TaxID=1157608 RepID=A0ABQ0GGU4_9PEZI